ncbi:hypothetical protein FXO37_35583 [Capsicum annuum]|nr:hypothetical protein FXO37_35583 [Capsicum annuum]
MVLVVFGGGDVGISGVGSRISGRRGGIVVVFVLVVWWWFGGVGGISGGIGGLGGSIYGHRGGIGRVGGLGIVTDGIGAGGSIGISGLVVVVVVLMVVVVALVVVFVALVVFVVAIGSGVGVGGIGDINYGEGFEEGDEENKSEDGKQEDKQEEEEEESEEVDDDQHDYHASLIGHELRLKSPHDPIRTISIDRFQVAMPIDNPTELTDDFVKDYLNKVSHPKTLRWLATKSNTRIKDVDLFNPPDDMVVHLGIVPTMQELGLTFFITLGLVYTIADPMMELINKELARAAAIRKVVKQGQPNIEVLHDQPAATNLCAAFGGVAGGVVDVGGSPSDIDAIASHDDDYVISQKNMFENTLFKAYGATLVVLHDPGFWAVFDKFMAKLLWTGNRDYRYNLVEMDERLTRMEEPTLILASDARKLHTKEIPVVKCGIMRKLIGRGNQWFSGFFELCFDIQSTALRFGYDLIRYGWSFSTKLAYCLQLQAMVWLTYWQDKSGAIMTRKSSHDKLESEPSLASVLVGGAPSDSTQSTEQSGNEAGA